MKKALVLWMAAMMVAPMAQAQSTIRCMTYNLLNFPEPNPPGKVDTLRKILAWHPVDLLFCDEVRTQAAANSVLAQALNVNGETRFSMAPWEPQHSGGSATYYLQQIIYYDHDKLGLKEQGYLTTYIRDLNWYTLYLQDPLLATTHDTTFLTVFAVHLKAGSTTTDANERHAMAQTLVNWLPNLPADRPLIVAGDMNLYSGFEPAFQTLIANTNAIVLRDPINTIGGWSGSSAYSAVHTQSTRVNAIYSDGAGGGLDDRFDIALVSSDLMAPGARLHYTGATYRALGNSGTCFDQNITDCSTAQTPMAILRSMYYMSDHLPVVFDLTYGGIIAATAEVAAPGAGMSAMGDGRFLVTSASAGSGTLDLFDMQGRLTKQMDLNWQAGERTIIDIGASSPGIYLATLRGSNGQLIQRSPIPCP